MRVLKKLLNYFGFDEIPQKGYLFGFLGSAFSQMYSHIQNYATQNWCNRHVLYVVHLYPLDIQM
jgi:hypothetical protein